MRSPHTVEITAPIGLWSIMMAPTINHPNVPHENSSCSDEKQINANKNPMTIKMAPPLVLALPVGIDSFLEPLAGALGAFRW
jgi:hypothetical protein